MIKLDVAIIGAGSGGLSARREVAKKTQNYKVFDGGKLGTTCARVGCMPSKVLIQAANDFYRRKALSEEGIHGGENLYIKSNEVMSHVRKLRDRFVRAVVNDMKSWTPTHLVSSHVKFIDAHTLEDKDGNQYYADKIIIASGSSPSIPAIFENHKEFLITTDEFFELDELPESMAVIGLGVIGIELGQAIQRLGVPSIGIARRRMIAGIEDLEIREYVCSKLEKELNLSFDGVQKVERVGNSLEITTGDKTVKAKKVLVTTGRRPNWDSLNLSVLNLSFNQFNIPNHCKETFKLDDYDHLFLAGDITGEKQILHEASDEGKIAGYNAVNGKSKFQTRTPLTITFSDPNIAQVGMTVKELEEQKIAYEFGKVSFEGQGRSIVKLKEIGLLKVYGDKKTGQLLGAEMFGPDAEHIAHLLSWVIQKNMTVNEVLSLPFYHPVIEEGLRTSLRDLRSKVDEQQPPLEIYPKA